MGKDLPERSMRVVSIVIVLGFVMALTGIISTLPSPAYAVDITTYAFSDIDGALSDDSKSATSGGILSEVTYVDEPNHWGGGYARAFANVNGSSAVTTDYLASATENSITFLLKPTGLIL